MSAVAADPNLQARQAANAAAHILDLATVLETLAGKVAAAHRTGNPDSAFVVGGRLAEYQRMLLVAHQRAVLEHGRRAVDRALVVELRRRAHKAGDS